MNPQTFPQSRHSEEEARACDASSTWVPFKYMSHVACIEPYEYCVTWHLHVVLPSQGVETSATGPLSKQAAFMDQLLDIVMIRDAAEDPMTKSLLSPVAEVSTPCDGQTTCRCHVTQYS